MEGNRINGIDMKDHFNLFSISLLFLQRKRVLGRGILKETVAPKKGKDTLRSLPWSSLILVFERLADGQRSDAQELLFSICLGADRGAV